MALEAQNVWFSRGDTPVLQGVDLSIAAGEIVGLQGPSGIGKSTLGRLMCGLLRAERGTVRVDGTAWTAPGPRVQYLIQDPAAGMNDRWRVQQIVDEAGDATPAEAQLLDPDWLGRYPHEISGGQLQRVNLARALRARPRYLVADEITASLDALTQAQVWHELLTLARAEGLGVLVISHDRDLLGAITDRIETLV